MTKRKVIIGIEKGLHLRVAGMLARKASEFKSEIFLQNEQVSANCKSVMGVAVLGSCYGDELIVSAEGEDENKAILSICYLLETDDTNKKTNVEIFEHYISGASWMDTDGRIYIVKGFHEEWINQNKKLIGAAKNVEEVIEKLNWINVMIYRDKTIEFHSSAIVDNVLKRINYFLKNTTCDWTSAHIFTIKKERQYLIVERELFNEFNQNLENIIKQKKLIVKHY